MWLITVISFYCFLCTNSMLGAKHKIKPAVKKGEKNLNMADKEMITLTDISCWLGIHAVTKIIKLNNKVACRQSKSNLIIFELSILDEKSFPAGTKRIKHFFLP